MTEYVITWLNDYKSMPPIEYENIVSVSRVDGAIWKPWTYEVKRKAMAGGHHLSTIIGEGGRYHSEHAARKEAENQIAEWMKFT